jgi:hypothetical protein
MRLALVWTTYPEASPGNDVVHPERIRSGGVHALRPMDGQVTVRKTAWSQSYAGIRFGADTPISVFPLLEFVATPPLKKYR